MLDAVKIGGVLDEFLVDLTEPEVIFQTAEPFNESTFLITAKFLVV
jgi:hypothetical protein